MRIKIVTFVPTENADDVRQAMGKVGAGKIGEYSFCSFSTDGTGRFIPSENAHPHIGQTNQLETVREERIEAICSREDAKLILAAIRKAHPYEEVAFDIYPLIDESEL
jgi:hypothetical protein